MEAEAKGRVDPHLTKKAKMHVVAAFAEAQPAADLRLCGQLHQAEQEAAVQRVLAMIIYISSITKIKWSYRSSDSRPPAHQHGLASNPSIAIAAITALSSLSTRGPTICAGNLSPLSSSLSASNTLAIAFGFSSQCLQFCGLVNAK